LGRFWLLVPGGLLGALDLVERQTGKAINVPPAVYWIVLGAGFLFAAFLTYHELRISTERDSSVALRRKIGDEIGAIINEGAKMAHEGWPGVCFSEKEYAECAAEWWNSAGAFIEATIGAAERHIISEPQRAPSLEDLLRAHCTLLRGTLQRLPHTDLQVGEAGLQDAIATRHAVRRWA
jgi:hypothetical protein